MVYFTATAADPYGATATTVAKSQGLIPAPVDPGLPPRYQSHTPTPEQIAAGMTRNTQDEPNVGVNWTSGNVLLQALLQTLRVRFEDLTCPQTPGSTWQDVSPPTAVTSFDPILFTDHETDRTFVSHLLVNPLASATSLTEDDGDTWQPSQGAGPGSGVDHQTLGGGPFHDPPPPTVGDYPHAVYYCMAGIENAVFPAMVAGDGGRTAVAFYGSTSGGDAHQFDSETVWHLYVAHTYDGGDSWVTVNATPDDPLQRGGIHLTGGSQIHRNLLDFFDADLDAQGRMVIGYADGCIGACVSAPEGGLPLISYQVFRAAADGPEELLATLDGSTRTFVDSCGSASGAAGRSRSAASGRWSWRPGPWRACVDPALVHSTGSRPCANRAAGVEESKAHLKTERFALAQPAVVAPQLQLSWRALGRGVHAGHLHRHIGWRRAQSVETVFDEITPRSHAHLGTCDEGSVLAPGQRRYEMADPFALKEDRHLNDANLLVRRRQA